MHTKKSLLRAKKPAKKALEKFDKHFYYIHSVQSAEHDAELLWHIYKKMSSGKLPSQPLLQEDFCGTASLCFEWAKLSPKHRATGIDLDAEALIWGAENYGLNLSEEVLSRVDMIHGDVLVDYKISPNIICALNFSYFIFAQRSELLKYFKACRSSLAKGGLLILDSFGGPDYLVPHSDKRRNQEQKFSYWWDIESFDAISHQIKCHIHYQRDGESQRKKVFSYTWRLWSIPEITDILREAGFKTVEYWAEGLDRNGDGNGEFKEIKSEFGCQTWMTYIIAK